MADRNLKLVLAALLLGVWSAGCSSVFYYPARPQALTPADIGLRYEDVALQAEGEPLLHGWLLRADAPRATILFLHGNAGNISTHLPGVHWLPAEGFDVFMPDYRGYGESVGTPSAGGVHADAERAIAYLTARPDVKRPLVLFGQSLGGTTALYLASLPKYHGLFAAVIAESAFRSYREIVREKLGDLWLTWPLRYPLAWFIIDRYSPAGRLKFISPTPVLLVHGTDDATVPLHHSADLFAEAAEPKELWIVPGSGHIDAFGHKLYRERLTAFIDRALAAGAPR